MEYLIIELRASTALIKTNPGKISQQVGLSLRKHELSAYPVVKINLQHHAREGAANGLCSLLQLCKVLAQKSWKNSILRLGHGLANICVSLNKRKHFRAG